MPLNDDSSPEKIKKSITD
nr:hypothetical protein [Halanaerobium congolense]